MKNIYIILVLIFASTFSSEAQFQVRLVVNNTTKKLCVQLRNTTSSEPTTSQMISSINMQLMGSGVAQITSIDATNYTMDIPNSSGIITMTSVALQSPENWIQNQWVNVVKYNLTSGMNYTPADFMVTPDLDGDNSDVEDPIMSVLTPGLFNIPLMIQGTILPVSLTYFDVNKQDGGILSQWTTANEVNNDGFELQKSMDGSKFNSIAWIEGHGTTSEKNTYSYLDSETSTGFHYYRLKQIDNDGRSSFSDVKSVMIDSKKEYTIYPNPSSKGTLEISGLDDELVDVVIHDSNGRFLSSTKGSNGTVDVSHLQPGLFFVQINNGVKTSIIRWVKL